MAHKIDTETAVEVMPVAAAAGTPGWFTDADPLNPTHLDADWCNSVQAAVTTPVTDNGKALDKADPNQFATLLSGVHGTISSTRTNLATTGASTYDKQAASAVTNAIASGAQSQCNAGENQRASGAQSQCNAGSFQTASGQRSQCNAGLNQTASSEQSQCNAGLNQTASGAQSQCNVGSFQTASGAQSQCNAGFNQTASSAQSQCNAGAYQHNSANRAAVTSGQYYELIDDNCWASGYGAAAPADLGDGLTNKNLSHYLNAETGEARHKGTVNIGGNVDAGTGATIVLDGATGDIATVGKAEVTGKITAGGTFGGPADAPLPITQRALTASVDWATSAAEIECLSPLVSYEDSTEVEITLTIANSDSGPHDVEMGSTVLIDISGIQATGGTLIGAYAATTAGSTTAQKGLRWSCGIMLNSSGNPKLAVTSVGKATAAIAGSGAESVTVKIYLTFAALKAV